MLGNFREFCAFAWGLLAKHPRVLASVLVCGTLAGITEGVGISLFVPLIAGALPSGAPGASLLARWLGAAFAEVQGSERVLIIGSVMAVVIVLRGVLGFVTGILYAELDRRISHALRSTLYDQCLYADYTAWERIASDELFNTLTSEAPRVVTAVVGLVSIVVSSCTAAIYVGILLLLSWRMTLAVVAALLVLFVLNAALSRRSQRVSRIVTHLSRLLMKRQVEMFEAMKLIRTYGREDYEHARYEQLSLRMAFAGFRMRMLGSALGPIRELGRGGLVILLFAGASLLAKDIGTAIVFLLLLNRLEPQGKDVSAYVLSLDSIRSSLLKVWAALDTREKFQMRYGSARRQPLQQAIIFDRVSFRYDDAAPAALEDLCLRLEKGEATAIVGPSGAGKTTVLRLLMRLHDPSTGQILIDGVPLPQFDRVSLRARMAYVSQEAFLFDASIRWNIAYGAENSSLADVTAAAELAGAHDFICALPAGYNTPVGPRGGKLSGGERQRVMLARALLRKPDILILDEATSALDSISEDVVRCALSALKADCAIVLVSHRFALVEHADKVLVMRAGKIVEHGTFDDLIRHGGLFSQLHAIQHSDRLGRAHNDRYTTSVER